MAESGHQPSQTSANADPARSEKEAAWEFANSAAHLSQFSSERAAFDMGYKAAAKSRDQRIKELQPYIQHGTACRARRVDYGDQHPCTCGLDALQPGDVNG